MIETAGLKDEQRGKDKTVQNVVILQGVDVTEYIGDIYMNLTPLGTPESFTVKLIDVDRPVLESYA